MPLFPQGSAQGMQLLLNGSQASFCKSFCTRPIRGNVNGLLILEGTFVHDKKGKCLPVLAGLFYHLIP